MYKFHQLNENNSRDIYIRFSLHIDCRVSKSADESIDRKQGSTHLPEFPRIDLRKPAEYSRPLTMNDVPKIRLVKIS